MGPDDWEMIPFFWHVTQGSLVLSRSPTTHSSYVNRTVLQSFNLKLYLRIQSWQSTALSLLRLRFEGPAHRASPIFALLDSTTHLRVLLSSSPLSLVYVCVAVIRVDYAR
jgi:hypothetical protein